MVCKCAFSLFSKVDNTRGQTSYSKERYNLPCDVAVNFLKQLDSRGVTTNSDPDYKVLYNITTAHDSYSSPDFELPRKAAAKIDLFMKDRDFMPASDQKRSPPSISKEKLIDRLIETFNSNIG